MGAFVHTGSLQDVEQATSSIENLLSSSLTRTFDSSSSRGSLTVIDSPDAQTATIILRAYPFSYQTEDQIEEQKRWILFLIYDLLQQFGVDFEYESNAMILALSNRRDVR